MQIQAIDEDMALAEAVVEALDEDSGDAVVEAIGVEIITQSRITRQHNTSMNLVKNKKKPTSKKW